MSEPFLAEIRMVGFNFPPRGWSFCDGQILPINQNQSLFSLLGTTYGGDGRTSFALPDLRGRVPIHVGASNGVSHALGSKAGEEAHTLAVAEIPQHDHPLRASASDGDTLVPSNNVLARSVNEPYISPSGQTLGDLRAGSVTNVGGQSHDNMQPFLVVNFCIALQGLFPSRN